MGEGHRLLGSFRGGGNMRVGTLVKWVANGDLGIVTEVLPRSNCKVYWAIDNEYVIHDSRSYVLEVVCV